MSDKVIATFLWMEILRESLEFKDVDPTWYKNIKAAGLQYYQRRAKIRYVKGREEFSEKVIEWIQTAILIALGVRIGNTWFGLGSHPLSSLNEKGPVQLIDFIESQKTTTVNYPNHISDYLVQQFQDAFPDVVTIKAKQDEEERKLYPELQQQELLIKKQKQQEIKEREKQELLLEQAKKIESEKKRLQEERVQAELLQRKEEQEHLAVIQSNLPGPKSQEDQEKENIEQQKSEQEAKKRVADIEEREKAAFEALQQKQQQEILIQTAKFKEIDEKFNQEQEDLSKELNQKRKEREQEFENEKRREAQQRVEDSREREKLLEREKLRETSTPVSKLNKEEQPSRIAQWWSYFRGVPPNVPQLQQNAAQLQQTFKSQDVLVAFINNPDHRLSPESLSVLSDAIRNVNLKLPVTESKASKDFWAQATLSLKDKAGLLKNLDNFMSDHNVAVYVD